MTRILKITAILTALLVAQVTLLPPRLLDPFKPDLLLIAVTYLALTGTVRFGGGVAFLLGLVLDCFSGQYLGLNGFSFLAIYLVLEAIADRLYTDNLYLLILVVFLVTVLNGMLHLILLVIFSVADGVYATLLPALLPQGLVNALSVSLLSGFLIMKGAEDEK